MTRTPSPQVEECSRSPELIRLGEIAGVHGIRGWVKVFSATEPRTRIFEYPVWRLDKRGERQSVTLGDWRENGKRLIARFEEIGDRDAAELLRGATIGVLPEDLPALAEGDYYWYQLQGLQARVRSASGETVELGEVDHLLATGANDVLVIRPTAASIDARERLIPWSREQTVRHVDLDAGCIELDWDPEF